jgi:uncharacterized membrane protein
MREAADSLVMMDRDTRLSSVVNLVSGEVSVFWYVFDKGQKRYIAIEIHQRRLGLANCAFECNPRFAIPDEGENHTLTFRSF